MRAPQSRSGLVGSAVRALTSPRIGFWILAAVWLLGSALLAIGAFKQRFAMTNIDGVSYIRIAELYRDGYLGEAINAYWSPMVSWTMLPFMSVGIGSQAAFFFAVALWSSIGAAAGTWFVWKFSGRNLFSALIIEGTLLVMSLGNLSNLTPDLIVVAWAVLFVWVLVEVDARFDSESRRSQVLSGLALGAVCALGFFVKQFLIPVFVVVVGVWLLVRIVASRRRAKTQGERGRVPVWLLASSIVALLVISGPWVAAMSVKYGGPTLGSSFEVNVSSRGTEATTPGAGPNFTLSLPGPPSQHYIFFNDDRTAQLSLPAEPATASTPSHPSATGGALQSVRTLVGDRLQAFPTYLVKLSGIAPFGIVVVGLFFLLRMFGFFSGTRHQAALFSAAVFAAYFAGYAAIVPISGGNLRYYWPLLPLSTLVAVLCWPSVWARLRAHPRWWRTTIAVILICLIPVGALVQNGLNQAWPFSTARAFASVLYLRGTPTPPANEVFAARLARDGVIAPGSRIVGDSYSATVITAFYLRELNVQVWGWAQAHNWADPAFQQVLREKKIDFYLHYQPAEQPATDESAIGPVVTTYLLPYSCGSYQGQATAGCELSIIRVNR